MFKSDKLTPLIHKLEKIEHNLVSIEYMLNREDNDKFVEVSAASTPITAQFHYMGFSLCLYDEIAEKWLKDLHAILQIEARKQRKEISKKTWGKECLGQ